MLFKTKPTSAAVQLIKHLKWPHLVIHLSAVFGLPMAYVDTQTLHKIVDTYLIV